MRNLEITGLPVDQRGHHYVSNRHQPDPTRPVLDAFLAPVHDDEPWTDGYASAHGAFSCKTCDMHPGFDVVANPEGPHGLGLRAKTECLLPNGMESVFYLSVRSGKIVVADSLRPVYDLDLPLTPGYNSAAGQNLYSVQMAALGVATGATTSGGGHLVRLGSPTYGVTDGGRYAIVSFDDEAEPGEGGHFDLGPSGEVLADIDFTIWAYAIADYGDFQQRLAVLNVNPDEIRDYEVVDFPNGLYQFVHHATLVDHDTHDAGCPLVYADIAMVGPQPFPR